MYIYGVVWNEKIQKYTIPQNKAPLCMNIYTVITMLLVSSIKAISLPKHSWGETCVYNTHEVIIVILHVAIVQLYNLISINYRMHACSNNKYC